jgi:hypothetical protein
MGVLDALRSTRASLAEHDAAKTADEIARREAERDPAVVEAAQMLGMKDSEVVSVEEADEGLVITTTDGSQLVLVSPDRPDGAGKVGLMFLRKPRPDMVTDFPVYASGDSKDAAPSAPEVSLTGDAPAEPAPAELVELVDTTAGEPGVKPLDKLTKKELLAKIDDLRAAGADIDIPAKSSNADLIALIEAVN